MNNDKRLSDLLIEKSKNGYAIISVFNPDVNQKKRNNGKRSKSLMNKIIDYGFSFKSFSSHRSNGDVKIDFIVFDKFDDGFTDPGMRLEAFLEECKENYRNLSIQYDIEEYLKDKKYHHPIIKSEKFEYLKRKEIILEDLFEPPEAINGWTIKKAFSETSFLYEKNSLLCAICKQEDGSWKRTYGSIRPVGVTFKTEIVKDENEAFQELSLDLC